MEEMYWKRFTETGKIADYLYYKGMEICRQVMDRCESGDVCSADSCKGDTCGKSDYSDRHGACGSTHR